MPQINTFLDRLDVNNLFPNLDLIGSEPFELDASTLDIRRGGETALPLLLVSTLVRL
ncbi:hypothetical protein [Stenomitos frigidus]|uniref:hypothetical protein n=1 Tax=Stenomitos frigidus TaxID=1886765 RepID=UPI0015E74DD6|nr:hypothetical protein [Stenomitos frigidus]